MSQYLLTIYQPVGNPPPPDVLGPIMRDVTAVRDEMKRAGVWVFSGGLDLAAPTVVVRSQGEGVLSTDGPYVEGKEHVGGITIIEASDLETALEWAGKLARASTLAIEVRRFAWAPAG
jgi:hypothetical protein